LLDAPGRAAAVLGVIAVSALAAWMIWQPLRSANADTAAVTEASRGDTSAAIADAESSASINPLSVDALFDLAAIYQGAGNLPAAHRELERAVSRQPSNPATWVALASFDLQQRRWISEAKNAAKRAHVLDRGSTAVSQLLAAA
jgi:tetratricopeptide (TPR) repeat protein